MAGASDLSINFYMGMMSDCTEDYISVKDIDGVEVKLI